MRKKDIGRDNFLRGVGFLEVPRIDVRDTPREDELDGHLSTMLRPLIRDFGRGKVLNVQKARRPKVLNNIELPSGIA